MGNSGSPTRRDALAAFGGSLAAILRPRVVLAQDRPRSIGLLMARRQDDPEAQRQYTALIQALAELGWVDGRTMRLETRWVVGDPAGALAAARELVELKPDILLANATPSLIALRQATTTHPIVFVSVADPVGQGFVPSLSRPGGNITGFSVEEASMGGKWLEVLKEAAPRIALVATIYNPDTAPYAPMFQPSLYAAADRLKLSLRITPVHDARGMEYVIQATAREPNSGLLVLPDSFMFAQRTSLVGLMAKHNMPALYPIRPFATDGGLIAYGIDRVDLFRRAATYVDRILKGAKPSELPVQQPVKFELAINLKTAKALGLTIPQSLLLSADEVIE
ncbi:ABC transporter substrate-binding protein [Rhodoplanes sp. Z2-YC6860]|uniref:ABC transporter substrate-binding protein n=1 Tax=Rhodoplanes sp. Z2-YC6860 TaxID=674703 RepID=UPI00078B397E|nr:ABC transporter substrate-binding protein [Rhodoplanes sp. Z2-YC6860]AMN41932.1 ABC transporter substrate binding protein [Rhodoplanes sp. Z2-YC6860]